MIVPDDEGASLTVATVFNGLAKRLRALDLPVKVHSVEATSAVMRYTDVHPPVGNALGSIRPGDAFVAPVRGIIRLEDAGGWPNELNAFRKVLTAMYVRIAALLREKFAIDAFPHEDHVDVICRGIAFSLAIYKPHELGLLREAHPEAADHLALELVHRPLHTAAIHALALRHRAFARSARLAKRWVHAHMFSKHIAEEAVELLVAHVFTASAPELPPASHITAFFRFLRLLAGISPSDLPALFVVDLDEESGITAEQWSLIQSTFDSAKAHKSKKLPPSLFIATSYLHDRSVWTASSPPAVVMRRMIAFARHSADLLESLICGDGGGGAGQWRTLFNSPLADFDFVVHLDPLKLTRTAQALPWHVDPAAMDIVQRRSEATKKRAYRAVRSADRAAVPPVLGFDPASLLYEELVRCFGDKALFFHDSLGGSKIAGVWRPGALDPVPWKLKSSIANMPVPNKPGYIALNVPEVLQDIAILGSGIVTRIETKTPQQQQQ
jgi:U3 small nucleolar RNA-associated protein 22